MRSATNGAIETGLDEILHVSGVTDLGSVASFLAHAATARPRSSSSAPDPPRTETAISAVVAPASLSPPASGQ